VTCFRTVSFHKCKEEDIVGPSGGSIIDKIREEDPQVKLVLAVSSEKLGTMIAPPLDTSARTKQVFARLRKICELDKGVMLLCQTEKSLWKLMEKRLGNKDYFPAGVRCQMDFMLGRQNFNSVVLNTVSEKDWQGIMVIGAHITHRNIDSKYCPSIAAVVASTDSTSTLKFPGSARFQQTTRSIEATPLSASLRRHPNDAITDLKAMLVERFAAWSNQKKPPTSIMFYRDSMNFADSHALVECATIKKAFTAHFGDAFPTPLVTYIIVNKNVPLWYPDTTKNEVPSDAPKMIGDFVLENGVPKYRYYVVQNEGGYLVEDLRSLVSLINIHPPFSL
jgi:hypothetical protein